MTRRQMRDHIFKQLFLIKFHESDEYAQQCDFYIQALEELDAAEKESLKEKVAVLIRQVPELDEKINAVAEGWKTSRMGSVDLTVLRLALYEILYDEQVPTKVAINEAVEIAKTYGGDDSSSFVNAILGKLVKSL